MAVRIILCTCLITLCSAQYKATHIAADQLSGSGSGSDSSGSAPTDTQTEQTGSPGHDVDHIQGEGIRLRGSKLKSKSRHDGGSWPETEEPPEEPEYPSTGKGNGPGSNPSSPTEETGSGSEPPTYPSSPTEETGSGSEPPTYPQTPGSEPQPTNNPPTTNAPSGAAGSESETITYPPIKVTGSENQPVVQPPAIRRPQTITVCKPPCTQYAVAIRAETNKTILNIYEFTRLKIRPLAPADVIDLLAGQQTFLTPGLFNPSILQSPSTVVQYLSPLINIAVNMVPGDYITDTPLFFYVPRNLRSIDAARTSLVIREAIHFLVDKYQVPFPFSKMGFAIKEAASSWVTLNFLRGAFKKRKTEKFHSGKRKTVGILNINPELNVVMSFNKIMVDSNVTDLIRASDNVFALVADGSPADLPNILLNYVMAANNGSDEEVIDSPCHPRGFEERLRLQLIPKIFVGTGNRKKCREILKEVIPHFMLKHIQTYRGHLYTFSSTVEALKEAGCSSCTADMKYITPYLIVKTAQNFCESSGNNIYACLQSSILIEGLTHRYGLRANRHIRVLQNVSGVNLEWSLGAILVSLGLLETDVY